MKFKIKSIAFLLLVLLVNFLLISIISALDSIEELKAKINDILPRADVENGLVGSISGTTLTTTGSGGNTVVIDLKDLRYLSTGTTIIFAKDSSIIFNKGRSNEAAILSGEVKRNSDGSFNVKNANLKIKGNSFSSQKDASLTLKIGSDKIGIKSDSEVVEKDKDGNIVSKFKGEVGFYDGYKVVAGGTDYHAYDANGKESYKFSSPKSVSISDKPNFKTDDNSPYIIAYNQDGQNKMIVGGNFGSVSSGIELSKNTKFDVDATSVKFEENGELLVKVIGGGSYKITSGKISGDSKVVPGEITGKFTITDKNGKSSLLTLDSSGKISLDSELVGKIIDKTSTATPSSAISSIIDSEISKEKPVSNFGRYEVIKPYATSLSSTPKENTILDIVKVGEEWCPPCRAQETAMKGMAEGYNDVGFYKALSSQMGSYLGSEGIPQTLFVYKGEAYRSSSGGISSVTMKSYIESFKSGKIPDGLTKLK